MGVGIKREVNERRKTVARARTRGYGSRALFQPQQARAPPVPEVAGKPPVGAKQRAPPSGLLLPPPNIFSNAPYTQGTC